MREFSEFFEGVLGRQVIEPRYALAISFHNDQVTAANPNLLTQSEDFSHTDWTKSNSPSITANSTDAPDGNTTADTIEDANGSGFAQVFQAGGSFDAAKPHTFSIFIKKDSTARATRFPGISISFSGSTTEDNTVAFDTSTADTSIIAQPSDDVEVSCEDYDGDYWRVRITATSNDAANTAVTATISPALGADANWAVSTAATGSVIAWGAQLAESSSALHYVATTTETVTAGSSDTNVLWLTSHGDCLVLPGVGSADRIDRTIGGDGISGQTQKLHLDRASHSVGSITLMLIDRAAAISDRVKTELDNGYGLNRKRVTLYMGASDSSDWVNGYQQIFTHIIDGVKYLDGRYTVNTSDIQRIPKATKIFRLHEGHLSSSIDANATSIPITADDPANKFPTFKHDSSYASEPGSTVGYIELNSEIIIHSGWNGGNTALQVVKRGAFGTRPRRHVVNVVETSRKPKVLEYVYLEGPAPKILHGILTGISYGDSANWPDHWSLGIASEFVKESDFTALGEDLWDTTNNQGARLQFTGLEPIEAKKFYEEEILSWIGCFTPVYADGALGLQRFPHTFPEAAHDDILSAEAGGAITKIGDLSHKMKTVINSALVRWGWIDAIEKFNRSTLQIDSDSISRHQYSGLQEYEFRGVFPGNNTDADIFEFFQRIREYYGNPPEELTVTCKPEWVRAEVGDSYRVIAPTVRSWNQLTTLDRVYAVAQTRVDWVTGAAQLKLFGGAEKPTAVSLSDSNVLSDSHYDQAGTELSTVLTISGGAVTASGTLTGAAENTNAIFYYNGDLTINSGVTIDWTRNVILRVRGFITYNGDGDGTAGNSSDGKVGKTFTGAAAEANMRHSPQDNLEIGTIPIKGRPNKRNIGKFRQGAPVLNLRNMDGTTLRGIPKDLSGMPGLTGPSARIRNRDANTNPPTFDRDAAGGAGGAGGGSLVIVCRGMSVGVDAAFNLSGSAGSSGSLAESDDTPKIGVRGQTGGGGFPGTITVLIDGNYSAPTFSAANVTANRGAQDIPGTVDQYLDEEGAGFLQPGEEGYGQDRSNDTKNYWLACTRVQFIPPALNGYSWSQEQELKATVNTPIFAGDLDVLQLDNFQQQSIPITRDFYAIAWAVNANTPSGGRFVAVGSGGGSGRAVWSDYGSAWFNTSTGLTEDCNGVCHSDDDDLFVTVGDNGFLATSQDGESGNWVTRTTPNSRKLFDIAYGDDGYFVVAMEPNSTPDASVLTATDPTSTWTRRTVKSSVDNGANLRAIARGNGYWIVAGSADDNESAPENVKPMIYRATDPTGTWSAASTVPELDNGAATGRVNALAYGNGMWLAACSLLLGEEYPIIMQSTDDGDTWTLLDESVFPDEVVGNGAQEVRGVRFIGNTFIFTSYGYALTSEDAVTWNYHQVEMREDYYDIAYNGKNFVMVGEGQQSDSYSPIVRSLGLAIN